jgi:DNA-binding transcriptional ArsR family regulator
VFGELLHIDAAQAKRLRAARPSPEDAERLAGGFRALGEPTRLSLALALRDGHELCVCDLSWIVERPQNLVSHHMKALKAEGVVSSRRDGKMTMYMLTGKGRSLLSALEAGAG